jgi:hypothetical protein
MKMKSEEVLKTPMKKCSNECSRVAESLARHTFSSERNAKKTVFNTKFFLGVFALLNFRFDPLNLRVLSSIYS